MRPWSSAIAQDFRAIAACFFQGIGQAGQAVEGTVIVNGLGQIDNPGRKPGGGESVMGRNGLPMISRNRIR